MLHPLLSDDCVEVLHGEFYSVFRDHSGYYWVVNNDFSSVFLGPFSPELSRKIMISANEYYNLIKSKGLSSL